MKIYKYLDEERIENILIDNLLRFTQPHYFNDPFEIRPCIKGLADESTIEKDFDENILKILKEQYEKNPNINKKLSFDDYMVYAKDKIPDIIKMTKELMSHPQLEKNLNNIHYKKFNEYFGILSLTTDMKNLLTWAHYANSHKGFVVEFDSKSNFFYQDFDEKNLIGKLHQVIYNKIRPQEYYSNFNVESAFLTKSEDWKYEDEYRMFMPLKKACKVIEEQIYLFEFPSMMIKSIYLGVNISEINKLKALNIITSDYKLKHIKLYSSKISENFFELEFNCLN